MDSAHVVVEVPAAGEAVARDGAVTALEEAKVRVIAVAVEAVSLALVAEETGVGGELQLGIHAGGNLAAVGLQVRVQVFAIFVSLCQLQVRGDNLLICTLLSGRGVVAGLLSVGEWAVVFSIGVGGQRVERMIPGVLHLNALLSLTKRLPGLHGREELLVLLDLLRRSSLQCGPTRRLVRLDDTVES